jgi:hypothetical protein
MNNHGAVPVARDLSGLGSAPVIFKPFGTDAACAGEFASAQFGLVNDFGPAPIKCRRRPSGSQKQVRN